MKDVLIQETTEDVVVQQATADGLVVEQISTEIVTASPVQSSDGRPAARAAGDRLGTLLAGAAIGAGLMYLLDPDRGARRRHVLADQVTSALRSGSRAARERLSDASNRARGLVAETRGRLREGDVDDDTLVARVRAELGRHVEHARAIEVVADGGTVTLRGAVPAGEQPALVAAVSRVRGVQRVDDRLDVREAPGR